MKLTKKEREEVTEVYDTWLNSYLTGDVETYDSFFDSHYHFIGSTENEQYLDRKNTTKFFKDTADQLAGKVKIQNNRRTFEKWEGLIFVTELFDSYFLIEGEWTYYGKFRFTSSLKKNKDGWRFIYQHFSTPDSKAEAGETIGTQKIAAENLMLREAVKRRTIELEDKNRELEIESALERVRTTAMSMYKPEDLSTTGKTIFNELKLLGFESIRNTEIIINHDVKETVTSYHFSEYGQEEIIQISYKENPIVKNWAKDLRKAEDAFVPVFIPEKEMKSWDRYRMGLGYKSDPKMAAARGVHYYSYSIGLGALSISTWVKIPDEKIKILERFRNVFKLSYQRYIDIAKAEAQAREAQVEASLERVRVVAMRMMKLEALMEVCEVLFKELQRLGFSDIRLSQIFIFNDNKESFLNYQFSDYGVIGITEIQYNSHRIIRKMTRKMMKAKEAFMEVSLKGSELKEWKDWRKSVGQLADPKLDKTKSIFYYWYSIGPGAIGISTFKPVGSDQLNILDRFRNVFKLSYQRYVDIAKAEAQAREAQIEAALERVRSRSIAMRRSEEIADIAGKIFGELRQLDLALNRVLIWTFNDAEKYTTWWSSNPEVESTAESYRIDYNENPVFINYLQAWQQRKPIHLFTLSGDTKKTWEDHLFEHTEMSRLPMEVRKGMRAEGTLYTISVISDYGLMMSGSFEPLSEASIDIIQRFGRVFQQSYTRYLDVQKAEAQAREAEIQLALERIRARALAMHHSDELQKVVNSVFEQMKSLDLSMNVVSIFVFRPGVKDWEQWVATSETDYFEHFHIPYVDLPVFKDLEKARKKGKEFYSVKYSIEQKNEWFTYAFKHTDYRKIPAKRKKYLLQSDFFEISFALSRHIGIQIAKYEGNSFTDEENMILNRFTGVFEQAYTRFLDLQKAESQAREAQIEAALERVRSRSMGMQKSEELKEVIRVVYDQFVQLKINVDHAGFVIDYIPKGDWHFWIADQQQIPSKITHPYFDSVWANQFDEAKEKGIDFFTTNLNFEEKNKFYQDLFSYIPGLTEQSKEFYFNCQGLAASNVLLENVALYIENFSAIPYTDEENKILKRIGKVFQQTYTRFLDLQKVEAQAREAQIEAALERVRAKAMGMHSSNDLSITASMVFTELRKLGVNSIRSGVGLFSKESRKVQLYSAIPSATGDSLSLVGWVQLEKHPVLEKIYETWLKQEDYFPEMQGEELRSYYQSLLTGLSVPMPEFKNDEKQFGHFITSSIGCLYAWSEEVFNGDQLKIFRRFASIIDLTFRRYLELQKAEAQALEAVKQASLDRVRAEIASMRTADDLNRITPLIWRELTTLGVPFFRCGVFIVDDEAKKIDSYLSNPEGESLAAWRSDYDTIPLFKASVKAWKQQQVYRTEWDKIQFIEFSRILVDQGLVQDVKRYQAGMNAPDYLSLQMIPFKQGMLYVGSAEKLKEDQIELVQTLASAFSIAYSRYEDFRQLEKAKSEVEQTLTELKSTQTQLIHSEKMASLGELTAGIAHEIQNPLNFVNNFSEVSEELIEELIQELSNGDLDEAREISNDVIENLRKINHHGQRASSIVKGMLEHSRSGTNKKELTDINILADEYLRLAYHGLRAKDKTFQAEFKTDLDSDLPKIKLIGQEIGRVLLNLINNAFYAVSEKSKRARNDYVPTVIIQTKRQGNIAEIRVKDNADGIPANVVDKIFQPFFTTKPSGLGTGLGLSLSYDIITKGHDGHLEVDTQEGIGTEFIIRIPII